MMIWESWYWKKPLLDMAQRLEDLKSVTEITDELFVQIEKDIFIGFYSIRKLIETITRLTDETKNKKLSVYWYPNTKKVNWKNNHKIDELYDLEHSSQETRDIWFISSRIVHSFIFTPILGKQGGLEGIFFTSDTDKDKKLYQLDIDSVIEIFKAVGNDDPTHIEWRKNPETGEETTIVK